MSYPRGLIRYTTENAMEGKPAHVLRPRIMFVYALFLLMLSGGADLCHQPAHPDGARHYPRPSACIGKPI
jgi:hypothetical protein